MQFCLCYAGAHFAVLQVLAWRTAVQSAQSAQSADELPVTPGPSKAWCDSSVPIQWSDPLHTPSKPTLGQSDVYTCSVLHPPSTKGSSSSMYVALQLGCAAAAAAAAAAESPRLRHALLLDCDAQLWQLSHVESSEAACIASTSVLRAACNQW
jgi:hypothetical protein